MSIIVAYYSRFGNTKKVAAKIAETLSRTGQVRLINSDDLSEADLKDANLVIMGCPTHKMNLPEAVRPLFDQLPRRILKKVPVAAFDTSYKMNAFLARFTAAKRLARKLRRLGGKLAVPPETFYVEGREGPLCQGEIDRARDWTQGILKKIKF